MAGRRPAPGAATDRVAWRIEVTGTVQGVGFRPHVWRLANGLGLDGTVRNAGGRVEIEAAGTYAALTALADRLVAEAPPRARVERVVVTQVSGHPATGAGFHVVQSTDPAAGPVERLFPPDLATCDACVAELFDPYDRRHRYPFINCTDCGPRATIIDTLPYDRDRTTMADFPMCPACRAEYTDPANRRFHAEPVACAACGPRLSWRRTGGPAEPAATGEPALAEAVAWLSAGGIVAVKGLGGYHLACRATDGAAVARLRERKHRWAKPLAVMVADLDAARELADLTGVEAALLANPARPIVLAAYRTAAGFGPDCAPLAPGVLAGSRKVGLFLPYTGLHHLLMAAVGEPLVLTSGNRSDEPIAIDDLDAAARLSGIADGMLGHDRRIRSRYEDSVVTVVSGAAVPIRRGRGYAPDPVDLPVPAPEPVLAVGAELKHTFAIARGGRAHLASHTGDLEDLATFEAFRGNLAHLRELLDVDPGWVAHDRHPAYLSTGYATEAYPAARRIAVQHHHAHVAACAAEHGLTGPVVGVALDGLGWGDDGTFWGGEVLVADLTGYRRVGRFGRAPMPGGAAAVHHPWRMALGYLYAAETFGDTGGWYDPGLLDGFTARFDAGTVAVIRTQVARELNSPVASSAGRLFDAVSSLLGLRDTARYEGEAAIALEQAADPSEGGALPYLLREVGGVTVYDPRPTIAAVLYGLRDGTAPAVLAARFQRTVARATAELAATAARRAGLEVVCLSGGVFQNEFMLTEVPRLLREAGLTARCHARVPPNDGGISYGQAAVAAAILSRGGHGRGAKPAGGAHGAVPVDREETRDVPGHPWSGTGD